MTKDVDEHQVRSINVKLERQDADEKLAAVKRGLDAELVPLREQKVSTTYPARGCMMSAPLELQSFNFKGAEGACCTCCRCFGLPCCPARVVWWLLSPEHLVAVFWQWHASVAERKH